MVTIPAALYGRETARAFEIDEWHRETIPFLQVYLLTPSTVPLLVDGYPRRTSL
jgi:hypothetical protein